MIQTPPPTMNDDTRTAGHQLAPTAHAKINGSRIDGAPLTWRNTTQRLASRPIHDDPDGHLAGLRLADLEMAVPAKPKSP